MATTRYPNSDALTVQWAGGKLTPINIVAPFINGVQGSVLSVTNGTWLNGPTAYSYIWMYNGVPVPNATASTFNSASFTQFSISVRVSASNADGSSVSFASLSQGGTPISLVPLSFSAVTGVTTAKGYSGPPEGLFIGQYDGRAIFDAAGLLVDSNHLYGVKHPRVPISLPSNVSHPYPGGGFTCTGLDHDGTDFFVANLGKYSAADPITPAPSVVRMNMAGVVVSEILLNPLFAGYSPPQGIAIDSSDATIWITDPLNTRLCVLTKAGVAVKTVAVTAAPNGLAYDSIRNCFWINTPSTLRRISKAGADLATFADPTVDGIDHIYHDPIRDMLFVTSGVNSATGILSAINPMTGLVVNTATLSRATAPEGIVRVGDTFWVAHDGGFHAADNSLPAANQLQPYSAASLGFDSNWPLDRDPLTGAVIGYLVEPACTRSNTNSANGISSLSMTGCTGVADTAVTPFGWADADTLTATDSVGVAARASFGATGSTAAGVAFMHIAVKKTSTSRYIWLADRTSSPVASATFDLQTKVVSGVSSGALSSGIIETTDSFIVYMGYLRVGASGGIAVGFGTAAHPSGTNYPMGIWTGTETLILSCMAYGNGQVASLMPFNGVYPTRAADTPRTAISAWDFSSVANTFVFSARTARASGVQVLAQIDDGSENNRYRLFRDANNVLRFVVTVNGIDQCNLSLGTVANNTSVKVAIRGASNDFAASMNGGAVISGTGTLPDVNTYRSGNSFTGEQWGGWIKTVDISPTNTDNAGLIALAA